MSEAPPTLNIASRPCAQCLCTPDRIVSGQRAAEIVRRCLAEANHFICHKSPPGAVIHCRAVHDLLIEKAGGSKTYRLAHAFGFDTVEVDMDQGTAA